MEPILFYGVPQGCSFGSIVALEWLGEPYRLTRIEMMEHPWPELYRHVNPLFQTPSLLLEDGTVFSESIAIFHNLAARGIEQGLGFRQGTRAFDHFNHMLAYLNTDYFSSFNPLWVAYEKPGLGEAEKQTLQALGREKVTQACDYLNEVLSEREWLLGDERTLVDAYFTGVGRWIGYHRLFDVEAKYPHLHRYYEKLRRDPAYAFAQAIEKGESPAGSGGFKGHVALEALRERLVA